MVKLDKVIAFISSIIPGFRVAYKNESRFMKFLAVLVWPFNRRFMEDFTTTIGQTVYFPSRDFTLEDPESAVKILLHEFVHLWDGQQQGLAFSVRYLLPQLFAAFPLIALLAIGWFLPWECNVILGAVTLFTLLPLPAPWRTDAELRGYTMSLAYTLWTRGLLADISFQKWHTMTQFTGWGYYKMWPFEKKISEALDKAIDDIRNDRLTDEPFISVKRFLEDLRKDRP